MIQIDNYSISPSKVLHVERFASKTHVHIWGMDQPLSVPEWPTNPLYIHTLGSGIEINPENVSAIHQTGLKKTVYLVDGSRLALPNEVILVFPSLPTPEAPPEEPVYNDAGDVIVEDLAAAAVLHEASASTPVSAPPAPKYVPPKAVKRPSKK